MTGFRDFAFRRESANGILSPAGTLSTRRLGLSTNTRTSDVPLRRLQRSAVSPRTTSCSFFTSSKYRREAPKKYEHTSTGELWDRQTRCSGNAGGRTPTGAVALLQNGKRSTSHQSGGAQFLKSGSATRQHAKGVAWRRSAALKCTFTIGLLSPFDLSAQNPATLCCSATPATIGFTVERTLSGCCWRKQQFL